MTKRLIFIVGLQKSGTTLLLRMLSQCPQVENPFKSEGNDFWGNIPPFTPTEFPAGFIYQRSKGEMGHEISEDDSTPDIFNVLNERLASIAKDPSIVANKNPYNTVRLPWIKRLFPDSVVVATVRRPIPNVFSLLKKHVPHEDGGLMPEEGWWGVKPGGWRKLIHENKVIQCSRQWSAVNEKLWNDRKYVDILILVNENKVIQCSRQWSAVNEKLWNDRKYVDILITYQELCTSPSKIIDNIVTLALGREFKANLNLPPINCFDLEYRKGSRLLSKNKYFNKSRNLITPETESVEIGPFKEEDIDTIEKICSKTANMIEGLQ